MPLVGTTKEVAWGVARLRQEVSILTGVPVDDLTDDADLLALGLDSVTVMRISGLMRKAGRRVEFRDLVRTPTLDAWQKLLGDSETGVAEPPDCTERPVAVDCSQPFPLALMQHAFWIGRTRTQDLGDVAAHFYSEFDHEGVEPDRLERAMRDLIARHPMLRVTIDGTGMQWVTELGSWPGLVVHDLRELPEPERLRRLASTRDTCSHRRMDVGAGEVIDLQLSLLPGGRTRVHLDLDMIAGDALSLRNLLADLTMFYEHGSGALPALEYHYGQYLADRGRVRATAREHARQWWRTQLAELPAAPELPLLTADAPGGGARIDRRSHWLSPERAARLRARAQRAGLTTAGVLATVFAETIGAWSSTDRFLLNLPAFDREPLHDEVDRLVGDFSSSVLLDVDLATPMSVTDRGRAVADRLREVLGYAAYSGVEVLRDLSRAGDGERVLAPVVYTSALSLGELYAPEVRKCLGDPVWTISQGPQVWLDAQVTEFDGGILLNWDARVSLFPAGLLDTMFDAYVRFVELLLDDPGAWDRPSPWPVTAHRHSEIALAPALPLHRRFFDRAATEPDRTALIAGGTTIAYGELSTRARRMARLLRDKGIGRGDSVAITLPKGVDQIVAALGVLAAGATYVPSGIDLPPARRTQVYRRAGARLVITDRDTVTAGSWPADIEPVHPEQAGAADPLPRIVEVDPEDVMYVIFTSGSTGTPKGVEIPHRAVAATVDAVNGRFGIGADDRTIALSALDFDLSAYDLFAFLAFGGSVVVIEEAQRRDAAAWADLIRRWDVTVVSAVPALLDMLLTAASDSGLGSALRLVMLGGDRVTVDLPGRLRRVVPGCRFAGLGGMTEAAVHATVCEVDTVDPGWSSVPYGVPLPHAGCRVVDRHGRDCPDWAAGELWVTGLGLAHGYRGDPERTAERFVEHDGIRWYRTGDLVRYRSDGTLEFLGRTDHQVKIRGHRIELGEIEAVLAEHPRITAAAAAVLEKPTRSLGAVVATGSSSADLTDEALRSWLGERLPGYMVPRVFVRSAELPITRNGKIDRAAVHTTLAVVAGHRGTESAAPRGRLERIVADAWAAVLDIGEIRRDDDFFALGGDSLLATRLIRRLLAEGVAGADLAHLFTTRTLAAFAATLTTGTATASPEIVPEPAHRNEPFPLTDIQVAYWLGRSDDFDLGGIGAQLYIEYDWPGIDAARLESAWNRVIDRHSMLRAVITADGAQRVLDEVSTYRIPVVEAAVAAVRDEMADSLADAGRWPLFDIRVVRDGADTRVCAAFDTLIADGLSVMVLLSEWTRLYAEPDAVLPELGLEFRDYVRSCAPSEAEVRAALSYWRSRLPELPPGPQLPLRVLPATVQRPRFVRREVRLDADVWSRIAGRARGFGVTPSVVLLACYTWILGNWSAQRDLTVTLTRFDRRDVHPDIMRVVGDFSSLLLVADRPVERENWLGRMRRLQEQLWRDLDHQQVSAVRVLRELARNSEAPTEPVPVVFTSMLGVDDELARSVRWPDYTRTQTPQVWLDHQVIELPEGLLLSWDSVDELFPDGLVDEMLTAYHQLVDGLAEMDWEQPLGTASPTLPPHQQVVRDLVNSTTWPGPLDAPDPANHRLLHTAMFDVAAEDPGRPALVDGDVTVSFGELAERSRRVAALLAARGVRPGDVVAVCAARGAVQVVALYGVLAVGAAYVPVAVDQPVQRRAVILEQAGVVAVLTDDTGRFAAAAGGGDLRRVAGAAVRRRPDGPDGTDSIGLDGVAEFMDAGGVVDGAGVAGRGGAVQVAGSDGVAGRGSPSGAGALADQPDQSGVTGTGVVRDCAPVAERVPVVALADARYHDPAPVYRGSRTDLAYVIFTSGSTGVPKGVEIEHGQAVNTLADLQERYRLGAQDRVLAVAAVDFDLSVFDLFGVLGAGGSAVLVADADRRDPGRWLALVREHGVTVWNTVPAMLDMLLMVAESGPGLSSTLRLALVSGDWVGLDLPGRLADLAEPCRLVALGGATEAAIWSNFFEVDNVDPEWSSIPYGRPLRNQRFRVVDEYGRDRPDRVPGELLIGGAGVARGYRGRPDLTAASFFEEGGIRWYRTGDLGRYRPDGVLEFLGRADRQVKIRGHRVELGEIEQAITAHPEVRRAFALAVGERAQARLVAFVEPGLPGDLTTFLADRVPAGWAPELIALPNPPLTGNGKIDHAALVRRAEAATAGTAGAERAEPLHPGPETRIGRIWQEVLGGELPGRNTNFFAAGGDSLSATRLVSRLSQNLGITVRLREFFTDPTIAGLGHLRTEADAAVPGEQLRTASVAPVLTSDSAHRLDPFGTTDIQAAYWLGRSDDFDLGGIGAQLYFEYDLPGLDVGRLARSWNRVIERHPMLRAVIGADGRQRVLPETPEYRIAVVEPDGDFPGAAAALREVMAGGALDAGTWPLFDIRVLRAGAKARVCVVFDSLVVDGLSALVLISEWTRWYRDPGLELAPLTIEFRDYVTNCAPSEAEVRAALSYWRSRLPELPPGPQLPLRVLPATVQRPRFVRRERRLDPAAWHGIVSRARGFGVTPSVVLLACYTWILGNWSAQRELTVTLTRFDRRDVHPDIMRVVGDFSSLLLVADHPVENETWLARVRRLQEQLWSDLDHQQVSAVRVLRELARESAVPAEPVPVVFTSMLGVDDELAGSVRWPDYTRTQTPQVWLDHQVIELPEGLLLSWDSVDELFPDGLVEEMLTAYHRLLAGLGDLDWEQPLDMASPALPPRQRAIRDSVNDTAWPRPGHENDSEHPTSSGNAPEPGSLLHTGMFEIAAVDPGRPALVDGDVTVSFGELAERSRRVAALLAARGVRPGDVVAVCAARGAVQVAALYGVLAVGAAYVPVAVDQPVQRRAAILEQAGVVAVLTDDIGRFAAADRGGDLRELAGAAVRPRPDGPGGIGPDGAVEFMAAGGVVDGAGAVDWGGAVQVAGSGGVAGCGSPSGALADQPDLSGFTGDVVARYCAPVAERVPVVALADARYHEPAPVYRGSRTDLAYVIFTSGSTGVPKGVEIEHGSAVNTLEDLRDRYDLGARDRVLALAAVDFDLSVFDLFGVLGAGGSAVLVPDEDRRDPGRWLALIREHSVTVWNTVPAMLDMLLTVADSRAVPLPSLRLALSSGDWVGLDLPGRLAALAEDCRFIALGGATEAAIWSNFFEVDGVDPEWSSIPYGRPLRNQRFRVVDEYGRDRPDRVPGELLIGGAGVARGYRGRPDLTAASFFEEDGIRWYRTGDLGRYRPDGVLEFLGRADRQVKIRGHRVELGEIEQAITAHPEVRRAFALAVGERAQARLVAFVEPEAPPAAADRTGPTRLPGNLPDFLADRIPPAWIPELVPLIDPPLTANGKVDHATLARRAETAISTPVSEAGEPIHPGLETRIARVWAETLGAAPPDRHTSFFGAGGDSLSATRLVSRLGRELGITVTLREFFTTPTIAGLVRNQPPNGIDLEEGAL
ncbi:non-ribosomal peptide synthetase [Nocardia carnea]|uniref:non-ribosomal peptide synthetase n=1 Tax=Nocardia carnea TaxID=37328 RepID=UPI00245732AB|nr:non-ribosomal peptide synthetase [Nocardia carnea]